MDVLRRHPVLVFGAVPLADVVRIREGSSRAGHERGRSLSPLGPPNLWLHLAAPAEIEGLLGITRRTGCLGLRVDDPAALAAALRARRRGRIPGGGRSRPRPLRRAIRRMMPRMERALPRGIWWMVALLGAVRLAIAAVVPLTVDEAYYAGWAAHLQPGYLDHPPLAAWLMAGGLAALGHAPLAARLPAVLLQAATTLLAADLAARRGGARAAWAAAVLLQAAPVFSLGAILMTPDAPLAFAWIGVLWTLDRALERDPRWLLAAGALLGVAGLSKLTAGALGIAVAAALATTPRGRALFRTPWPWAGAAVAVAVATPVLWWNATHGWANVAFQAQHGLRGRDFSLARLAASAGGQAAYVSPVLLLACVVPAWHALRTEDAALRAIAWSALPVVAFFTVAAAFTPGALPHWPAPGWLSALVLLAVAGSRVMRLAVWTGVALQAIAAVVLALPLDLPGDPRDEIRGWRDAAVAADAAAGGRALAATHWIALGQLGWYARAPVVYAGARPCAASLYEPDPRVARRPLLVVVVAGLGPGRADMERRLGPLEPAGGWVSRQGTRVVRRFEFYAWDPPAEAGGGTAQRSPSTR